MTQREGASPGDDGGIGPINDIVGFHIRLAHGAVYRHFMETFAHLDLTQKQVSVLWLVSDHPGIAQADLSRRLRMDRATVMAIVNRLQDRGYLERGRSGSRCFPPGMPSFAPHARRSSSTKNGSNRGLPGAKSNS